MFRVVVICGCLMAVAQAGIISGGLITGVPVAVQPTLTYRPAVPVPALATATSSNMMRGFGPLASVIGGRGLVSGTQLVTGIGAPGAQLVTGLGAPGAQLVTGLGGPGLGIGGIGLL